MRRLFGKRKAKEDEGTPRPSQGAPPGAVPPLPLQQLPSGAALDQQGRPVTPAYNSSGYLQSPAGGSTGRTTSRSASGLARTQSRLARTQSGMSSGRRSARRPREFIDLSQPEQVDGGSDDGVSSWGGSSRGSLSGGEEGGQAPDDQPASARSDWRAAEEAQQQLERDLSLAYQLALQDQQPPPALHQQQQWQPAAPPPAPSEARPLAPPHQQQQQQPSPPAWQGQPPNGIAARHSVPAAQQAPRELLTRQSLPSPHQQPPQRQRSFLRSLSLRPSPSVRLGASPGPPKPTASEGIALAAALAESQFAARQQAEMARQRDSLEAQYQAAMEAAMEESMVTINYDDLLRDIQLWIYDLQGANKDVNDALTESRANVDLINRQMAEANPDDVEGWHRIMWLSEQYPLVEERLRQVFGRVAPVNDCVARLQELCDQIRNEQPPLADAEASRDSVISLLFDDLGRQGLDAHHPFSAYGEAEAAAAAKPGRLRSLLSLSRTKSSDKPSAPRGGDLRDLVRQLIEEAKRIPEPPPLPVDYDALLAELQRWIEECEAASRDVDSALQDVRQQHDEVAAQKAAAMEDVYDATWHRLAWLGEQYPLAEARVAALVERVAPTNGLVAAFKALIERIASEKPSLADADAARDVAISTLFSELGGQGLDTASLPAVPGSGDMRGMVHRAIEEARRIPEAPPVPINYSSLLLSIQEWIDELEGSKADLAADLQEGQRNVEANSAEQGRIKEDIFDATWHRLAWLSQQYPLALGRLERVGDQAAPAGAAIHAFRDLQQRINTEQPPLEEAQAALHALVASLLADLGSQGLFVAAQPEAARGADVRSMVGQHLEEAKRIPPAPPLPVNYSSLSSSIQEWIVQLEGTNADVEAARQETRQSLETTVSAFASAIKDIYDPSWHQMAWLSQQYPLAETRVEEVVGQVAPTTPAIQALKQLLTKIEAHKPPLEEAQAEFKAAVRALIVETAALGLPTSSLHEQSSGADVRTLVASVMTDARRIPPAPPLPVDHRSLLRGIQEWIDALEGSKADLAAGQQETGAGHQDAVTRQGTVSERDREAFHLVSWLCEQYPLAEARLQVVEGQLGPAASALQALRDLLQHVETAKPPLEEVQASLDAIISTLLAGLGAQGLDTASLPASPAPADVRSMAAAAVDEAKRIPPAPLLPPIDYSSLLAQARQWIADCEMAIIRVQAAQKEAQDEQRDVEGKLAALAEDIYDDGWHQASWLTQQYPQVHIRLQVVEGQVAPAQVAIDALKALIQHIEADQPLLEDARGAFEDAIATLLADMSAQGLDTDKLPVTASGSDMLEIVYLTIEEAKRIPPAPPLPVNYSSLLRTIKDWIEQLEGTKRDVAAAQQEVKQEHQSNTTQLAATAKDIYDDVWHGLAWLGEQYPLAEERVQGVVGQAEHVTPTIQALRTLLQRIEAEQPPLEDAQASLLAAIATLLGDLGAQGLDVHSLPDPPRGADVRAMVASAMTEARRIPEAPPLPTDYRSLLLGIQEWIDALEGTRQDVQAAHKSIDQKQESNAAKKAAATEDIYDPIWHRLSWLSQQYPLADERVAGVSAQASPGVKALAALRQLLQRIETGQPSLEEARADLGGTIASLLTELSSQGLPIASLPEAPRGADVRGMVHAALVEAQRIPAAPPLPIDYRGLLSAIQAWIEALEGVDSDVATTQQEVKGERADVEGRRAALQEDIFDEAYHRLTWLSKEYPLVEGRVRDVAAQAAPGGTAQQALRDLQERIKAQQPPLDEAQAGLDAAVSTLLGDLGRRGLKIGGLGSAPSGPDVRGLVARELRRARRLGTPPAPPERPRSLAPPPPGPARSATSITFDVPNLTIPRPRFKSRGVRPAPEDAIKRDPRVITLYNELSKGMGVVPVTVAWEEVRAEAAAGRSPAGGRRAATPGGTPGVTPRGGASNPGAARGTPRGGGASPVALRAHLATPRQRPSSGSAGTPPPAEAAAAATPEAGLSEAEAAAYLPTLAARGAAIAAFQPGSLQDVADFVSDVVAQGGDAPRSGHAAAAFPAARWRAMADAAAVFDQLVDMCDTLTNWKCDPKASVVAESHRLAAYIDGATAAASRVMYPHDSLRQRMAKAGLPWDAALLTDLRWASQWAAASLMQHALDDMEGTIRAKGWNTGAVLQPLGSAAIGAFKVHQFCGGFNQQCSRLYDSLHECTVHYARMLDPKWLRSTKWA